MTRAEEMSKKIWDRWFIEASKPHMSFMKFCNTLDGKEFDVASRAFEIYSSQTETEVNKRKDRLEMGLNECLDKAAEEIMRSKLDKVLQ